MKHERRRTFDATRAQPSPARLLLTAAVVFVACWAAWASLRVGAARFFAEHALRTRAPREADLAASLAPADPDTHFARAWLLSNAGDAGGAVRVYERALALRPLDYVIWVELGKVKEQTGDTAGALEAFRRAVSLAPFYAGPRWQLGNALLRAGQSAEAVAELKRAAESDPRLYPNLVRTLWHASGRDPRALVRDAHPRTPDETLALARFLIKEGEPAVGLELLRGSGAPLAEGARGTLVADLIAAERFADAYGIWSEGRGSAGALVGGGFEDEARSDEQGFGWRFALGGQSVKLSLDADAPREGARSLKVEYAGNSEPSQAPVSRLVVVEPGARYRLTFAARTKEVVTGGPPFVNIVSAAKAGEALAESATLPASTDGWQESALEFTAPAAGAVRVALRRKPCATSPCPAFGAVWLDAFELRRLER